jgi:hypothetical protein
MLLLITLSAFDNSSAVLFGKMVISPFRSSDFLLYSLFCMLTGRKSGIRRSRPSSWIPLNLWLLMF